MAVRCLVDVDLLNMMVFTTKAIEVSQFPIDQFCDCSQNPAGEVLGRKGLTELTNIIQHHYIFDLGQIIWEDLCVHRLTHGRIASGHKMTQGCRHWL